MAAVYDILEDVGQRQCIRASTRCFGHLPLLPCAPLEAGCGTGRFAAEFVKYYQPRQYTLNDLSEEMVRTAVSRLMQTAWSGELHPVIGDIYNYERAGQHDLLVANFLLANFAMAIRAQLLRRLSTYVAAGGYLLVTDFSRPPLRVMWPLYALNYGLSCLLCWLGAQNPPNRLGDMAKCFSEAGLEIVRKMSSWGGLYASYLLRPRR